MKRVERLKKATVIFTPTPIKKQPAKSAIAHLVQLVPAAPKVPAAGPAKTTNASTSAKMLNGPAGSALPTKPSNANVTGKTQGTTTPNIQKLKESYNRNLGDLEKVTADLFGGKASAADTRFVNSEVSRMLAAGELSMHLMPRGRDAAVVQKKRPAPAEEKPESPPPPKRRAAAPSRSKRSVSPPQPGAKASPQPKRRAPAPEAPAVKAPPPPKRRAPVSPPPAAKASAQQPKRRAPTPEAPQAEPVAVRKSGRERKQRMDLNQAETEEVDEASPPPKRNARAKKIATPKQNIAPPAPVPRPTPMAKPTLVMIDPVPPGGKGEKANRGGRAKKAVAPPPAVVVANGIEAPAKRGGPRKGPERKKEDEGFPLMTLSPSPPPPPAKKPTRGKAAPPLPPPTKGKEAKKIAPPAADVASDDDDEGDDDQPLAKQAGAAAANNKQQQPTPSAGGAVAIPHIHDFDKFTAHFTTLMGRQAGGQAANRIVGSDQSSGSKSEVQPKRLPAKKQKTGAKTLLSDSEEEQVIDLTQQAAGSSTRKDDLHDSAFTLYNLTKQKEAERDAAAANGVAAAAEIGPEPPKAAPKKPTQHEEFQALIAGGAPTTRRGKRGAAASQGEGLVKQATKDKETAEKATANAPRDQGKGITTEKKATANAPREEGKGTTTAEKAKLTQEQHANEASSAENATRKPQHEPFFFVNRKAKRSLKGNDAAETLPGESPQDQAAKANSTDRPAAEAADKIANGTAVPAAAAAAFSMTRPATKGVKTNVSMISSGSQVTHDEVDVLIHSRTPAKAKSTMAKRGAKTAEPIGAPTGPVGSATAATNGAMRQLPSKISNTDEALQSLFYAESEKEQAVLIDYLKGLSDAQVSGFLNKVSSSPEAWQSVKTLKSALRIGKQAGVTSIVATPLMTALLLGNGGLVLKLLFKYDLLIDFKLQGKLIVDNFPKPKGFDLLTCAVCTEAVEVVQHLQKKFLPDIALRAAIELGHTLIVHLLLQGMANLGDDHKVFEATADNVELSLQDLLADVARMKAAVPVLKLLREKGAELSQTVIVTALYADNSDVAHWVLNRCEPEHAGGLFLRFLNLEVDQGCRNISLILKHKTNCYTALYNNGWSALMATANNDKVGMLKTILEHITDVPFVNQPHSDNGKTALHFAVESFSVEAVKALLAHGADPKIADLDGKSPLKGGALAAAEKTDLAELQTCLKAFAEIIELCENHGQDPPQAGAVVNGVAKG